MTLKSGATIIIILLTCLTSYGQILSERLILTDSKDFLYLKSGEVAFDRTGNYCFVIEKKGQEYFVTNKDTIGGFKFIGSTYGNGGDINYTYSYDPQDKPYYYKNVHGTTIYGTAVGKIESFQTSGTRKNLAIVTILNDTVYYYINGKLITKKKKEPYEHYNMEGDWVSFSENGNVIYFLNQDSLYHLYVNNKLIDSSKFRYTQLAINNNGTYIFAKGNKPEKPIGKYNYMFFIHSQDTVLKHVRTVWNYELKENGAYYYSGDDNGLDYIAINNKLYKDIVHVSNITLIDQNTYMFLFVENGENKINANGKIYYHDFDKIFYPTLDKQGNFAFYGIEDYYLYKFVNGRKEEMPISKHGVRATPLYISPKGESIHFFKTDDSIYLYQDEKLIFQPLPKNSNFLIKQYNKFLSHNSVRGKTDNGNSLFYLEYDKQGYFIFNGKFSEPMTPIIAENYSEETEPGSIVTGNFNDNGFFSIQKIDKKKYLITINNEIYQELDGIDYIISDSCFFDEKELIFYGVKGRSFYQFKLSL